MGSFYCAILGLIVAHPTLLVFPVGVFSWLAYRITHPALLPGFPATLTLLLPNSKQSHPYAATLSPLSYVRARWAFRKYARSRGYHSGKDYIKQIREDEDYDWANGEKPSKGDLVRGWDRVMVWDEDCIDMVVLESWRSLSDTLSDSALETAVQKGPSDIMLQIAQHKIDCDNSAKETITESSFLDFWDAVNQRPPRGSGAIGLDWYKEKGMITADEYKERGLCDIDEKYSSFETWKGSDGRKEAPPTQEELEEEARILQRGKQMFYRYGPPILLGLMHVGLSGGFASPRITDVLKATGYLMSGKKKNSEESRQQLKHNIQKMQEHFEEESAASEKSTLPSQATTDRTFRRLLETMSFVLDLMETDQSLSPPAMNHAATKVESGKELLDQGGVGWLSCCRVRFIHTNVRRRLSPSGNLSKVYSLSSGLPINQEDLLATLTSFSIAPLYTLQQMGISPSQQERKDYVALWRHVGFYMGIEPTLLQRVFRDVDSAERFFCCVASHHFLAVTKFKYSTSPPPISSTFGKDPEEIKRFHFDQGPALPLLYSVAKRPPGNMSFSTLCCLSRYLLGNSLANAVSLPSITRRQHLGIRLRLFILAFPPLFARYYPRRQFGESLRENCQGLLRRVVIWSMKGDPVSFESNREENKDQMAKIEIGVQEGVRLRRQYFHLMYEMLAVTLLFLLLAMVGLSYLFIWTVRLLASHRDYVCSV
ncbi:hypothetical protein CBS101457_005185 [Exobasidium rhododendri]|nr:hypothetical protein CBS101457_005185 [Exobasidium rhododendri]